MSNVGDENLGKKKEKNQRDSRGGRVCVCMCVSERQEAGWERTTDVTVSERNSRSRQM